MNKVQMEAERQNVALFIQLPRVMGDPHTVADEIARRATAAAWGYVYVGAYIRRKAKRRRRH